MKPYTPTEIIQAGRDMIRQQHTHSVCAARRPPCRSRLPLPPRLRREDDHRPDRSPPLPPRARRLRRQRNHHPDQARLPKPPHPRRPLPHGARLGLHDIHELLHDIAVARHDLDRMHNELDGTHAFLPAFIQRGIDIATNRANDTTRRNTHTPPAITAWDVPVRIPGTTATLAPHP